jgi:hypothetical protein
VSSSTNEVAIGGHHIARSNTEIEYAQKLYEPHLHFPTTAIERRRNMNIRWKLAHAFIFIPLALLLSILGTGVAHAASMNGAAGQMPAFYDDEQFTVNMKEMPGGASDALLAHNPSVNTIYASNDLDEEQDFLPVIDAIQGDGFNPLWQQVLIVFNAGFTPHQFTSDEDVLAAAAGPHPEITLVVTDEVYRCSVVGLK